MKTITLGAVKIQVFPSGACLVEDRNYETLEEMAEAEGLSIQAVRNLLALCVD
jgi:hypothetical protein